VIAIDEHDRVKLSRKVLLREQNKPADGSAPAPPAPPPRPSGGGDRSPRGGDRSRGPRREDRRQEERDQ